MSQEISGVRPFNGIIEGEGQQEQLSTFVNNELFEPEKLKQLMAELETTLEADIRALTEVLSGSPGEFYISPPVQITISPQATVIKLGREVRGHKD